MNGSVCTAALLDCGGCLAVGRRQDDPWCPGELRQLVGQIDSIAIRKSDVDEHRVGPRVLDDRQGLRRIRRSGDNLDPEVREDSGCEPEKVGIIVNNQHQTRHGSIIASVRWLDGRANRRLEGGAGS